MNKLSPFFTSLKELFAFLELPEPEISAASSRFSFLVSRHFASKMEKGNPDDPLLREVLPSELEKLEVEGFSDDPVGDALSEIAPGILQKYRGRVLIEPTFACGMHCRFCFRRAEPKALPRDFLQQLAAHLSAAKDIHEVILSGGDPMMLPRQKFEELLQVILPQEQIRTVRIHSRIPVCHPKALEPSDKKSLFEPLLQVAEKKKIVFVSHVDHPRELDADSGRIFAELKRIGATLLNQTTLLKGVNDSAETLSELSFGLFGQGVLPYYLHRLDRATGIAHFEVPDEEALQIVAELRASVPGYLVPRFVREIAGENSKTPIFARS